MKRYRKVNLEMMQIISIFLLVVIITAGLSFTAGLLTGRVYERKQIITILDKYYLEPTVDEIERLKTIKKEDQ